MAPGRLVDQRHVSDPRQGLDPLNPGDLILWAADNMPIWVPFAKALLACIFLAALWFAFTGWERTK